MSVLAGALLGLLGSAHCLAMCGPLVLAVGTPARDQRLAMRLVRVGSYQTGRVGTYALLGLVAGAAGSLMAFAGLGRVLALSGGVLLIAAGLAPPMARRPPSWIGPWMGIVARATAAARGWHADHPIAGPIAAGMANGLLPCGMVYAALATALAAGTFEKAIWTMMAFGAGTVPALAAMSLTAAQLPPRWRRRLSRAAPVALVMVGILLLVRAFTPAPVHAADSHPVSRHLRNPHRACTVQFDPQASIASRPATAPRATCSRGSPPVRSR
jgi:uncharacterized protein